METKRSFSFGGQAILGISAILVGILFLLDNMDIVDARDYLRFWPVILVAIGLARLVQSSHAGGRLIGGFIAFIGILLLLPAVGFAEVGFHELWPLILVLIGGSLILGSSSRLKRSGDAGGASPSEDSPVVNGFAVLGGFSRSVNSQDFRGGELSAVMGGCEVDLRRCAMQVNEAVINTFAFWGGIKIKVPPTWSVSMEGFPFMGGYDDKTSQPTGADVKRLVIKGTAIMGGVEITN